MKQLNHCSLFLYLIGFLLGACQKQEEVINKPVSDMVFEVSAESVEVPEFDADKSTIDFTWTKALDHGPEYTTNYVFKMDVAENDFRTAIPAENLGSDTFSKSFTYEELQNLILEHWQRPQGATVNIEVRIVAQFLGGPKFIPSEVHTLTFSVKSFLPVAIKIDKLYMQGSAVGSSEVLLTQAIEDPNLYAFYGNLNAGKMTFPIEFQGTKDFKLGTTEVTKPILDGKKMEFRQYKITESGHTWDIPTAGKYRVIVNVAEKTVIFYSVATDKLGIESTVFMHGPATASNWTIANAVPLTQSIANPNIWTYYNPGVPLKTGDGRVKFVIQKVDGGFAYSAGETSTNVTPGVQMTVFAGRDYRNNYYKVITAGMDFIVLDVERLTVLFQKK